MSLGAWKDIHYPISAQEVVERAASSPEPNQTLVRHAINKWEGLKKSSLFICLCKLVANGKGYTPYVTSWFGHRGKEENVVHIGKTTCALCEVYLKDVRGQCARCPIVRMRGYACDTEFVKFCKDLNPEPMIKLLKATLEATRD